MRELSSMEEFNALLEEAGDQVVIIDFYADWCGPCKVIAPAFKKLSEDNQNIITAKVNVDDADDISVHCDIEAMPTFLVFKNKKKVDKVCGGNQEALTKLFTNKY